LQLAAEVIPHRVNGKKIAIEADKVRCGQKHFEALGVPFACSCRRTGFEQNGP
jgi:hypothetical protein